MVNKKKTFKITRTKNFRKTKYNKNAKKFRRVNTTNRFQIGCSNKKGKLMTGGGINAFSQPIENTYNTMAGGISSAYNSLFGYVSEPNGDVSVQPHL